jgi:error-prone DNA polymerase
MNKCLYAPLIVFSNYSFLEGASFPEELVTQAAAFDLPALALTDRDGMYGAVRAHVTAREAGLKLLVGSTISRADGPPVVLLAMSAKGYGAICRLISLGRALCEKGCSAVTTEQIVESCHRHVLLLHPDLHLEKRLAPLADAFKDRFYAVLSRHLRPGDESRLRAVAEGAARRRLPLVAAPSVFFHAGNRKELADVLAAVRHGCQVEELTGSRMLPNGTFSLLHPAAFAQIYHDYPEAVSRTLEVVDRCRFSLDELRYHYPSEVVPPGRTPMGHLTELTFRLARERYAAGTLPGGIPPEVRVQLERELALIEELNYPNYFLTMHDIVSSARARGILCQGRGSAANSAVCYVLGITAVDPVRSSLLFERFISRERNEPPDIDVDFEHERREEVIQYIYERYGRNRAAMVAEFIRYRTRSAIRDVGKALGLSVSQVTRLSNLASSYKRDCEDWWSKAVRAAGLSPDHPGMRAMQGFVRLIKGFPRHLSIHVGGFIISALPITDLVPVEPARMEGRSVIQWDKEDVEDAGLLKVDILSLGMLTCLRRGFELIRKSKGIELDLVRIPPADPQTYEMIQAGDTVGVFQIESRAQMNMLPRLKPACFYDLVVEVAIVRPGPIQGKMVHPYLKRRQGLAPVEYPLPELEPVLGRTFGVPLFQEQVMKLAMVAAGFTGGEADQLRRAMGTFRSNGRLEGLLDKLMARMEARGISREYAGQIADQIKGFGEYGFPESHAASFALLAYASAYMKRHHPDAFSAALLNSQPMGFYSPATIVEDARRHGLEVRGICVNRSEWDSTLEPPAPLGAVAVAGDASLPTLRLCADLAGERREQRAPRGPRRASHSLRLGLSLVRGLRRDVAEAIVEERDRAGPFESPEALVRRTRIPSHVLLKLALAGALHGFGLERRQALWHALAVWTGGRSLFAGASFAGPRTLRVAPMPACQTVLADIDSSSVFLSLHPFELVRPVAEQKRRYVTSAGLERVPHGRIVTVGGLAITKQRPPTAGGILFLTLEDHEGFVNLVVRPSVLQKHRRALLEEPLLLVEGKVEKGDGVVNVLALQVTGLRLELGPARPKAREFQ